MTFLKRIITGRKFREAYTLPTEPTYTHVAAGELTAKMLNEARANSTSPILTYVAYAPRVHDPRKLLGKDIKIFAGSDAIIDLRARFGPKQPDGYEEIGVGDIQAFSERHDRISIQDLSSDSRSLDVNFAFTAQGRRSRLASGIPLSETNPTAALLDNPTQLGQKLLESGRPFIEHANRLRAIRDLVQDVALGVDLDAQVDNNTYYLPMNMTAVVGEYLDILAKLQKSGNLLPEEAARILAANTETWTELMTTGEATQQELETVFTKHGFTFPQTEK